MGNANVPLEPDRVVNIRGQKRLHLLLIAAVNPLSHVRGDNIGCIPYHPRQLNISILAIEVVVIVQI